MKTCSISDCRKKHHARGLCSTHYNKWLKYGDPTQGRENKTRTHKPEPAEEPRRPLKPRINGVNNVSYQLNIKIIEKLYLEATKTFHDPVYKGLNGEALDNILLLCFKLSGGHTANPAFTVEILEDLYTWASCRDRIQFMKTLEKWPESEEKFFSKNAKQMNLFSVK